MTTAGKRLLGALREHAPWFVGGSQEVEEGYIAAIEAEARRAALTSLRERVAGLPPFVDQSYRGASDDERLAAATISRAAVLAEIDRALG